jgi:hypothetical protein
VTAEPRLRVFSRYEKVQRKPVAFLKFRFLRMESTNGLLLTSWWPSTLVNAVFDGSLSQRVTRNFLYGTLPQNRHFETGGFSACSHRRPQHVQFTFEDEV